MGLAVAPAGPINFLTQRDRQLSRTGVKKGRGRVREQGSVACANTCARHWTSFVRVAGATARGGSLNSLLTSAKLLRFGTLASSRHRVGNFAGTGHGGRSACKLPGCRQQQMVLRRLSCSGRGSRVRSRSPTSHGRLTRLSIGGRRGRRSFLSLFLPLPGLGLRRLPDRGPCGRRRGRRRGGCGAGVAPVRREGLGGHRGGRGARLPGRC